MRTALASIIIVAATVPALARILSNPAAQGTWQVPGEIKQPKGNWQVPGEIQQPKGTLQQPSEIQQPKGTLQQPGEDPGAERHRGRAGARGPDQSLRAATQRRRRRAVRFRPSRACGPRPRRRSQPRGRRSPTSAASPRASRATPTRSDPMPITRSSPRRVRRRCANGWLGAGWCRPERRSRASARPSRWRPTPPPTAATIRKAGRRTGASRWCSIRARESRRYNFNFFRRCANVRRRSALRRMKPAASR